MKYLLIICCFLLGAVGAKAQDVPKIRIDPAHAFGGTVTEYFEEVNYIPLETTKESVFGAISSLAITDSSFVISDNDTHSVLFFKKDGKYISKIKLKEGDYPNVSFQKSTNEIVLNIYNSQTQKQIIQYFTPDGIKKETQFVSKSNELKNSMSSLGNGYYLNTNGCGLDRGKEPVDTTGHFLTIYKGDSVYKKFLPYNQANTPCPCALGYYAIITKSPIDSVLYATTIFDNEIYKVTRDTAQKLYKVVFPFNRTFSKELMATKDLKRIDSLRDKMFESKDIITGISNIHFDKNLLLFKISPMVYSFTNGTETEKQYNFIYNVKTEKLVSMERITPDEKSYYLPLIAGSIYMSFNGLQYNEGSYYGNISSLAMFTAHENTKYKNPKYPPVLDNYFNTEDRKSNPVIVQMKLAIK